MIRRLIAIATAGLLALAGIAHGQTQGAPSATTSASGTGAANCETQAVGKDGKPLTGAAKNSFMKKCMRTAAAKQCEANAVGSNGKPLTGAAKNSFVKKCVDSAVQ